MSHHEKIYKTVFYFQFFEKKKSIQFNFLFKSQNSDHFNILCDSVLLPMTDIMIKTFHCCIIDGKYDFYSRLMCGYYSDLNFCSCHLKLMNKVKIFFVLKLNSSFWSVFDVNFIMVIHMVIIKMDDH